MAKNFDDFVSSHIGKAYDIDGGMGAQCLTKGTLVETDRGFFVPIESLHEGDRLAGGNAVVSNNRKKADCLHVETDTGHFYVTKNHRFIGTNGQTLTASELKGGEQIQMAATPEESRFLLTDDELRFYGMWLADGTKKYRWDESTSPEIFVTVGTDAKCEYLENLDMKLNHRPHSNGKASVYRLINREHPALVEAIHLTQQKEPGAFFNAKDMACIVEGYCRGDGWEKKPGVFRAASISKALLLFIQKGCLARGWKAKLSLPTHREKTNYTDQPKDLYYLYINMNKAATGEVLKVEEAGRMEICILNTDGDHTYFAENHRHHNCWDGYAEYCNWLGVPYAFCEYTGGARDIWFYREELGVTQYFDAVSTPQNGDVLVWDIGYYGHIAMYYNGQSFGQNQNTDGSGGPFNLIDYPGWCGILRPKSGVTSSGSSSSGASSDLQWVIPTNQRYLTDAEMKNNARCVWGCLGARGWSLEAVCGVLGNMQYESQINPNIWQNLYEAPSVNGFGLIQWTPGQLILDYLGSAPISKYGNLQCQKLDEEAESEYGWIDVGFGMTYKQYKTSTESPAHLAEVFQKNRERGGWLADKAPAATAWYKYLQGTTPTTPDGDYSSPGSTGKSQLCMKIVKGIVVDVWYTQPEPGSGADSPGSSTKPDPSAPGVGGFDSFVSTHTGRVYGSGQCYAGFQEYCSWLGIPSGPFWWHPGAADIWEQRNTNGILSYFDVVSQPANGDVVFYARGSDNMGYGHVAMYYNGQIFGQNQNGSFAFSLLGVDRAFYGILRPKGR